MLAMRVLVLSCSMNAVSRSLRLAQRAAASLEAAGASVQVVDLRDLALPMADGGAAHDHPDAQRLSEAIRGADAVVMAVPIYNYYANAAAKNLIELTGHAWSQKIVGFLCAAGGHGSYMSVMSLANSLMLDFRCLIVPRFVFATRAAFEDPDEIDEPVAQRVDGLCAEVVRLTRALQGSK